jgi:hypothetical protein
MAALDITDNHADLGMVAKSVKVLNVGDRRRFEGTFLYDAGLVRVDVSRAYAEALNFWELGHSRLLVFQRGPGQKGFTERV